MFTPQHPGAVMYVVCCFLSVFLLESKCKQKDFLIFKSIFSNWLQKTCEHCEIQFAPLFTFFYWQENQRKLSCIDKKNNNNYEQTTYIELKKETRNSNRMFSKNEEDTVILFGEKSTKKKLDTKLPPHCCFILVYVWK